VMFGCDRVCQFLVLGGSVAVPHLAWRRHTPSGLQRNSVVGATRPRRRVMDCCCTWNVQGLMKVSCAFLGKDRSSWRFSRKRWRMVMEKADR
jgi:hypothetical protein